MCLASQIHQVLGIPGDTWNVIATISQALAAFGALALLFITWRSGKDTKAAIENSRRLAEATDNLVVETRAQQGLAVLPVIEVAFEEQDRRFRIVNKGNGPLLSPSACIDGAALEIQGQVGNRSDYAQVAALSCGGEAIINFDGNFEGAKNLEISGMNLRGNSFSVQVPLKEFSHASRVVARRDEVGLVP